MLRVIQISRAVLNGGGTGVEPASMALSAVGGATLHAVLLALNLTMAKVCADFFIIFLRGCASAAAATEFRLLSLVLSKVLRLGGIDEKSRMQIQQAVVILTSQRTLPVAVTVLDRLSGVVGEAAVGIAAMAAVIAHLSQIVVGSILVPWWMGTRDRTK